MEDILAEARSAADQLVFFLADGTDPVFDAMLRLLDAADGPDGAGDAAAAYRRLFALLAEEAEMRPGELIGDAWRHHLLERLLADDNTFTRKAALVGAAGLSPGLRAAARSDLRRLQALFRVRSPHFAGAIARGQGGEGLVPWEELSPLPGVPAGASEEETRLMRVFADAEDWADRVDDLADHFRHAGNGPFHRFRAFRFVPDGDGGHLEGVAHVDAMRLGDFIGYDRERSLLLRNTEHFLAGAPANNVLLYGERGTGKSSTVKALLNAYADRGLRLVEVSKQHLGAFPRILQLLRGRQERFILFVDDLSFEENETHYKDLKAVLEGGLEARPANVLVYATSNRRHLIPERFSDRDQRDAEIHARDTVQEKLSLSDRFGITITFLAPDQEGYLAIVEGLADQLGLRLDRETLRRRALQWAARHNGWSGRTARQFIDFALGEQAIGG